jgi:hypothetical protein
MNQINVSLYIYSQFATENRTLGPIKVRYLLSSRWIDVELEGCHWDEGVDMSAQEMVAKKDLSWWIASFDEPKILGYGHPRSYWVWIFYLPTNFRSIDRTVIVAAGNNP